VTIAKLHKQLTKLIEAGQGRLEVCIDKSTFLHPLEGDGAVILCVVSAGIDIHEMLDDDGGRKELANGQTATRMALVLRGD
jgi:hypothetical protein